MMKEYFWVSEQERKKDASRVGLVQLALPLMLESIMRSTVGMVDVAFLSRISDEVVSAVSISNQYITLSQIFAMAMATGATVCINQAIGMKNKEKVNMLATIAVSANLVMGLFFGLIFLLCPGILLKLMTLDASAIDIASRYMRVAGGLMFVQCVEIVLVNLCRSMGQIRAPLVINFIANIINVIGNYFAVFHPEWFWNVDPVVGVAVATVLSRVAALVIAIVLTHRGGIRLSPKFLHPFPTEDFKLVLSIGIPGGINSMAYSLSQIVTTSIISGLGLTMVAAKVYVQNIVQYVAIVGQTFSSASTIMVGYRLGANKFDEAKKVRSIVTRIALLSNGIFSLLLFTVRYPLLGIFTSDPAIIAIAANIFFIDFFVEIGRALNNSVSGALQAAGDVKFCLIINQGSAWILAVGCSYLFGVVMGMGLYGVWLAFACDELIRGSIILWRWRSDRWIAGAKAKRDIIAAPRG